MNSNTYIFELIKKTLDNTTQKVSELIRQSARIARLRNDYINLWWLELEMINNTDKELRHEIIKEVFPHFNTEQFKYFFEKFNLEWMNERFVSNYDEDNMIQNEKSILIKGVSEIETDIENFIKMHSESVSPQGLHHLDLYEKERTNTWKKTFARFHEKQHQNVLSRIRNRVNIYLSNVEKQILYGQIHSDIFEENRLYVEKRLAEVSPDALSKFVSAYQRTTENNPESWAQALTSCRRLFKALADKLYPPNEIPVKGSDGRERVLTDDMYVARLWQYVYEQTSKSTSGNLLQTQVQDIGNRIDRLYEMSCKGVHAEVSRFEVNQCFIQTYITVGDLLRLNEGNSAILVDGC